jgi:hypothetical protein
MKAGANEAFRISQLLALSILGVACAACIMLLLINGCSAKPSESVNGSVAENSSLREELLRRAREDQAIRDEWIQKGSDKTVLARVNAIDSDNQARMKAIIAQYGWPGPALVKGDGTEAAFILVQHADLTLQKEALPLVKKAYEAHEISGEKYALLLDRVLVREGKLQVYGTQAKGVEEWAQHEPVLQPIEDEANVDKRRAEVGLVPLPVYVRQLKETYFPDSQSRTNSVEGGLHANGNEMNQGAGTNSFPSLPEVFQGRTFENEFDRDVFFLRSIQERYPSHWAALLQANITVEEYVRAPVKLLRFINELGAAMEGRNDLTASTNLALLTSDESVYANTNLYHPEILRAAAQALIGIGPNGRKALATCFTEQHYRVDSETLEEYANIIGKERPQDLELAKGLEAMAFDFSTTNGGIYPRCITASVKNLLCLPEGASRVRTHLRTEEVFDNPGRFQAVIDGIVAAQATEFSTNLAALETNVTMKLAVLTNSPGAYRDDLQELNMRIQKTLGLLDKPR